MAQNKQIRWGKMKPPEIHLKIIFNSETIQSMEYLSRIVVPVAFVTHNILQRTWAQVGYRHDVCWATNGALIVTYLGAKQNLISFSLKLNQHFVLMSVTI